MDAQERIFENRYRAPSLPRVFRLPDLPAIATAAGLIAALIHAVVVREHLAHWWGYGVFFAGLAVAQALTAGLIARKPGRRLYFAVLAANAAVLTMYVLSRTLGTSFVGPHVGHPEAVGFIDLAAAAAEVAQMIALVTLLKSEATPVRLVHAPRWMAAALVVVAAAGFTAPVGPVHSSTPVTLLATASDETPIEDLHVDHPDEVVPTPPLEEEPVAEEPALEPCTPRLADAAGVPPRGTNGEARAIVYTHEGDLYLAAPPDGDVRRLTKDGYDCGKSSPVFRDAETISFSADSKIYDLDLRTGTLRTVHEVADGLAMFSWNEAGTVVAYMTWGSENAPPSLVAFTPSTGAEQRLRTFEGGGGRCGSMDDDLTISWSPDGRAVLLVATYFDFTNQTMFAVNLSGKDIIAPRLGTHALWGSDSDTVIYREFNDARRWFSLDIGTGHSTPLAMKTGTHLAAMSPDGRRIAYSNETENPSLFVFDTVTKTERVLTRGFAAPLWISSNEIVATKTKACTDEECGGHGEWIMAGSSAIFDLTGAKIDVLSIANTMDADALIDPASAPSTPSPAPSPQPSISPTPTSSPLPEPSQTPTSSPEPSTSPSPTAATT